MYSAPMNIPDEFHSERLLIRRLHPGDGAMIHAGVVEALESLRQWPASLPWAVFEPSVAASEAFAQSAFDSFGQRTRLDMVMILKATGQYVGCVGFHDIDWTIPKLEVGYWCRPQCQKQGLTSEALSCISDFAITQWKAARLVCLTDFDNLPSRAVAEKAGYQLEGVLRNERKTPTGVLRNTCAYARIA
jgi:RimJ/RimL family protein N-acetyltransferase